MTSTLHELLRILEHINALVGEGREMFDNDPRQQLAIERLWIHAGNLASRHCDEAELPHGVEPWSELIGLRNVYAHQLPNQIVAERVWHDAHDDIARLVELVAAQTAD